MDDLSTVLAVLGKHLLMVIFCKVFLLVFLDQELSVVGLSVCLSTQEFLSLKEFSLVLKAHFSRGFFHFSNLDRLTRKSIYNRMEREIVLLVE